MEDLNHTSYGSDINKKAQLEFNVDGRANARSPHGKNYLAGLPNGRKGSSSDDDVFHHLAKQLSIIDNLAHRDNSKPTSPEPAAIDLTQFSGITTNMTNTEAASNKYFEYHGAIDDHSPEEILPSDKRRNTATGEIPSVLKATGVCIRLEYPRVKITGEKDIADFAGVSYVVSDVMYIGIHI